MITIKTIIFSVTISVLVLFFISLFYAIWLKFFSIYFYSNFRDNEDVVKLIEESITFFSEKLHIDDEDLIRLKCKFPTKKFLILGFVERVNMGGLTFYDVTIHMNHSVHSIIKTVAHELIHVQQYQSGMLSFKNGRGYWNGQDFTDTKYEKRPWEVDAFSRDKSLGKKFMDYKGIKQPLLSKFIDYIF